MGPVICHNDDSRQAFKQALKMATCRTEQNYGDR